MLLTVCLFSRSLNWSCFAVPLSHGFVGITRSPAWHREQAYCASSRTTGGATRSRNRGAEKAPHFASCILSLSSNDAERSKATERVDMWRVPALDLGWVQMLVLWKLRFDGTKRTKPRGRCKSGECLQRRRHSDSAASRESAEEHECWSSGSCERCDCQQNRDSEAGNLCEGTVSCPAREGAGSTYACGGGSGEEAQRGLDCQRGGGRGGPACAEPPATDGRAHGEDLHGHGHWHERRNRGVAENGKMLVAPGLVGSGISRMGMWRARAIGERTALGMEVENHQRCSARFAAGASRCPSRL